MDFIPPVAVDLSSDFLLEHNFHFEGVCFDEFMELDYWDNRLI